MKKCNTCGDKLPLVAFGLDRDKPDGRKTKCRACRAAKRVAGVANVKHPKPTEPELAPLDEHRLKRRVAELESRNKTLLADLDRAETLRDLASGAERARAMVKPIHPRERKSGLREGVALALASDWHVEEEVRPEQVAGRNRYNLDISRRRMERFFEAVRWSIEFQRQAFIVRDLVLWLGGDIITNYLHPDNVESNLLSPVQAIAYAQASISAGIRHLLADGKLERIIIPCNDGNHGRLTEKTRSATRAANSIEWLLYTMLAREFATEPRVEFLIAEGAHLYYEVYGRTLRFHHGDDIRYGGGVGGITIPVYKAVSRWDTVRRADLTVLGHFHQLHDLSDILVNGSLIGYGPYSLSIGARFEMPCQLFTMLDSKRFRASSVRLYVADKEGED